ncbi:MAG: acetate--CoA ligase family protein [Acidobacteria bacterium]|nr:acetate--CoA ligase family protein [Acidobacteriota bacterium]
MPDKVLNNFFQPKTIAVIGASESIYSYGTRFIQAQLDFGYKGKIYAVNHKGEKTLGLKIYRSLGEIKDRIDLAFITIPARFILETLDQCMAENIKAVVAFTAGFSETGAEGRELEKEVVKKIKGKARLIGPNCFGPYCPSGGITVVTGGEFARESGPVALIAQSGQLSECIIARAQGEGIRYSKFASYGNAIDVNEADLVDFLMDDRDTRIITQYLEGARDGRRFFDIARRNAGRKPHIIWKVGLTQMGATASSSHTGSLAGTGAAWDAFFRQTGAVQVSTLDEMTDATVAFNQMPKGCGLRVGYISGGGAGTVLGADACDSAGMQMPAFEKRTERKLAELLPGVGLSFRNPVDVGNPHPPKELLYDLLAAMSADKNVDVVVVRRILFSVKMSKIFSGSTAPSEKDQQELLEVPVKVMKKYRKPIVIILPDDMTGAGSIYLEEERRKIRDYFFANGIAVFMSEQRTFTALSHLAGFKMRNSAGKADDREIPAPAKNSRTRKLFLNAVKKSRTPILDEIQCKKILKSAGIRVTLPVLAASRNEAAAAAEKMGFPVAMKIVSPEITHKSDIGGVKLKLQSSADVGRAYDEIMAAVRKKAAKARIDGVSVQKMAQPGLELVIGMTRDPQFGPMLMFGLGGTSVEILKDVAFRITPLTRRDAKEMIRQIKGYRLLEGYRGQPPVDIGHLEDMLMKLSAFIEDNPEIKEMDINPLFAYRKGAVAVDARIILDE